ncbi:hypothetical protein Rsub_11342 [Raphidocelis subcapitata]|uniref:Uncharacterized protein n=1 Tax=Raphidocelis subcapitata TaxID=307507 RepID=A0A2V0PDA2_9CHLO|nr:hypothetical protein Rsub_11342 [Raphidocelis subcapitata]|eukprot:GBF97816.1 hypothetical protein Rsub_11342 [Raphidocelis subcapitata]
MQASQVTSHPRTGAPARAAGLLAALVLAAVIVPTGAQQCTSNSNCASNKCCSTLPPSATKLCVASVFSGTTQVCNCNALGSLACPADKSICCPRTGRCVADPLSCSCRGSSECPASSCCMKTETQWAAPGSLGVCSKAASRADGKRWCNCNELNGVPCSACCGLDQRCTASPNACPCKSSFNCNWGQCCQKTPDAAANGGKGLCSAEAITGDNFCNCDELNGVVFNGPCCPTNKKPVLAPETDCPPCTEFSDCPNAYCCSKTAESHQGGGEGVCRAAALTDGGAEWCDCGGENLNGATCPSPVGPQNEAKCCRNGGGICQDQCPCTSNDNCKTGECCTTTAVTGSGVCVKSPFMSNGTQQCPNCGDFNGAGSCSGKTPFCCADGRCAANEAGCDCAAHWECPMGYACSINKKCTNKVIVQRKQIVKDCNDLHSRGMSCPLGASYCCVDGTCASSVITCKCKSNKQCHSGSCCTRQPGAAARGNCSPGIWNAAGTRQVCPSCLDSNGVWCPDESSICCNDGKCVASWEDCTAAIVPCDFNFETNELTCPPNQCCNPETWLCSASIVVKGVQVCEDCRTAINAGMACPTTKPVCCQSDTGYWVCATQADCDGMIGGKDVKKYQAHHALFTSAYADATFAMDDAFYRLGNYVRPDLWRFQDFRRFVYASHNTGTYDRCPGGFDDKDPATGDYVKGLDFTTAPIPLLVAADAAAQFWWEECRYMKTCLADVRADKVGLGQFKSWTTLAAQKILSYLQQAPAGRHLLCPPQHYFGGNFQIYQRSPDLGSSFFGTMEWAAMLNPVNYFLEGQAKPVNMVNLILRSQELKSRMPRAILWMEGLIELLISHDHSLSLSTAPLTNATILSAQAAPASSAGARGAAQPEGEEPPPLLPLAGMGQMDEGPPPDESFAANGNVAGIKNADALKPPPSIPRGCKSNDEQCVAENRVGGAGGGAAISLAAELAAAAPQGIAADDRCMERIREFHTNAKKAADLCKNLYEASGLGSPDMGGMFELGNRATYVSLFRVFMINRATYVAKMFCGEDSCPGMEGFLGTLRQLTNATTGIECLGAAGAASILTAGTTVLPGQTAGQACLSAGAGVYGNLACDFANQAVEHLQKAIDCCAGHCLSSYECANYASSWILSPNIPPCGGGTRFGSFPPTPYNPPPYAIGDEWIKYKDPCAKVSCPPVNECRPVAGVCDPATRACTDTALPDGTRCSIGACRRGECVDLCKGVTCPPVGECRTEAGVCDPGTGRCSDTTLPNGTPCGGGAEGAIVEVCYQGDCTSCPICGVDVSCDCDCQGFCSLQCHPECGCGADCPFDRFSAGAAVLASAAGNETTDKV